jgi:thymidylate kinase
VVEGLDGTGKTTLVELLANAIGAISLRSPPKLKADSFPDGDLRGHFDSQPPLVRRQYYRFAGLVASELAKSALARGRHVVMDRYWTSTAAFSVLDSTGPVVEFAESYPPEMVVPHVVVLLTVDEKHRRQRMHARGVPETEEERRLADEQAGRSAVLQAYRRFNPEEIDTSELDTQAVLNAVLALLKQRQLIPAAD